jgi:hypothetical protein
MQGSPMFWSCGGGQVQLLHVFVRLGLPSLILHEKLTASTVIVAALAAALVAAGRRSKVERSAS